MQKVITQTTNYYPALDVKKIALDSTPCLYE